MSASWFKQIEKNLKRFNNLEVVFINIDGDIEKIVERSMSLQANIIDNELTLINDEESVLVTEKVLY
jgi:uncharacterized protein YaeQ